MVIEFSLSLKLSLVIVHAVITENKCTEKEGSCHALNVLSLYLVLENKGRFNGMGAYGTALAPRVA